MMGSFISTTLILVFGYAFPAYQCFKEVEKNIPQIQQLLFWCHYWILVASFTFFERIGDGLISCLPMYGEAKLAFLMYLWHPKTKGTGYVYDCLVRPFVGKHEAEIDRNLSKLKLNVERFALVCWQMAWSYGHSKFFEILEYVSSHSPSHHVQTNQEDQSHVRHEEQSQSDATKQEEPPVADSNLETETEEMLTDNGKSDSEQQKAGLKESMKQSHRRWRLFQIETN